MWASRMYSTAVNTWVLGSIADSLDRQNTGCHRSLHDTLETTSGLETGDEMLQNLLDSFIVQSMTGLVGEQTDMTYMHEAS